ncbi:MAG: hypothetical protein CM15mP105_1780 [Methanobacteriota archaeon]|nr:MAG: hypothetical protein CM15mP105_1780 [Euryarchaeota archaeon]
MGNYHSGLWVIDIESLMVAGLHNGNKTEAHMESTVVTTSHMEPMGPSDSSYYDFGWTPFIWAAEYYKGYTYLSCITTGLYIVQLDIDEPYGNLSRYEAAILIGCSFIK